MRLTSISVENIRSYESGTITFPAGVTLLSGDIGSGKSTLLLGVEFALFGLSRGELTGEALLRHGADRGLVTMSFVAGSEYTLTRTLKRTKTGIVQDTGWLETDGQRETLTATELKARVYEILGYPMQFLGKKNLLYRFTLYTPQEEMKAILHQRAEERVETIRRVFGVERYKIVRDNAHLLARSLRERRDGSETLLARITDEMDRASGIEAKGKELLADSEALEKERTRLADTLRKEEGHLEEVQAARNAVQERRQLAAMQERTRRDLTVDIARLQTQRQEKQRLRDDARSAVEALANVPETTEKPAEFERELADLQKEAGKVAAILEEADVALESGKPCPVCKQAVSGAHLERVHTAEAARQDAACRRQERCAEKITLVTKRLQSARLLEEQRRSLAERKKRLAMNEEVLADIMARLHAQEKRLADLPAQDTSLEKRWAQTEEETAGAVERVARVRKQHLEVERRLAAARQELGTVADAKERGAALQKEAAETRALAQRDAVQRDWLRTQFAPLTSVIEQHVLRALHTTFDGAFRSWFAKLIEDDEMDARLDQEFSPVLTQQGYETHVEFLSGGERTAVALAYRLALVHTIHALVPGLGTAGLIMLDEPTDGFSSEQLERMRDVFHQLDMDQVVVVSHEPQLEGFVDQILHVRKEGGTSTVEKSL